MKARGVGLLPLAIALLLLSCAPPASQVGSTNPSTPGSSGAAKRLVIGIFADPPGIFKELTNPAGASGSVPALAETWQLIHAGFTFQDDHDVTQPWLAVALPTAENGLWKVLPDGRMEMTWTLRKNTGWHDDAPVGVDDLRFTLDVNRDRELGTAIPPALALVESVNEPETGTFVITWKAPFIEADTIFSPGLAMPLPKHLLERAYRDDKANFLGIDYWHSGYIGLGAFKVREWLPGSHATLIANDNYFLGRPKIDQIEIRFITEINTLVANVLAGAIDLPMGRGIQVDQMIQIRDASPDIKLVLGGQLGNIVPMYPQFLNPDPPIIANVQFRRALLMGVDRREMAETLGFGFGAPADSWLQPDRPSYPAVQSRIVRYDFDPRAAAQMIEGLGYSKGADSIFRDARGDKLGFLVRTTDQIVVQPRSTLSVADYWGRLGIDVSTENVPNQRIPDREYRSQFPAFELVSTGVTERSSYVSFYRGTQTPLPQNNFAGGNRARYVSAELDAAIDRYLTTIPVADRWAALGDIIHLQTEQLTMMPLFFQATGNVLGSKRLTGVTSGRVWNAYLWDLG